MDLRINGKSIYDSQIFAVFLAIVFVEPAYFGQIEALNNVYTYIQLFFTIFLLILSIIERKWTASSICIYLFFGTILLTTIFGSGNVYEYCATFFPTLGLCLMVDLWCKHNVKVLFNAIGVLEIYIYINLITVLLIPNGMYETSLNSLNWFLGYKNPQIRTILPIVSVSLIRSYWEKGRISFRSYALIICSMLTFILVDSSTALVGFAIFILLLVFFHQKEKRLPKVFTLTNVLIAVVLIFIGILFFGIQENFAWLIEGVLGKDLTFTSRLTPIILIIGIGDAVRQNYIYPLKMDSMMVKILGVNSIVNLILSAILIPYIGIYGAVIGTISAELVGMIIEMYVCRKYLSIKNVLANMLPFAAIGAIMYVCVRAVAQFYDGSLMALLVQVVVGATVYLVLTTVYAFASKSLIWEVIMSVIDRVRKRLIKR